MSDIILVVENISKQYRLGLVGTGTLTHDLNRFWYRIRGKEDPYLQIGAVNDRSSEASSDYVWAIKDINFEVKKGEVLGIIGKNGAGKSTLLKILSRVTSPTTGSMKTKGRIASLLEVGTGMHPELTGKENIFLNGAILGMSKAEINAKIDEIVEFSGCQMYIDTPVKRYSSGMRVRLGFAVAAFLEPDILVIDEVLAVGDAEFQKKAIGKMQDISSEGGRTVLFVSHNMAAVKSLCTRAVVLEYGNVVFDGGASEAVDYYLKSDMLNDGATYINEQPKESADILNVQIVDKNREVSSVFGFDDQIHIRFTYSITSALIKRALIGFRIKDQYERVIFSSESSCTNLGASEGVNDCMVKLPAGVLVPNEYRVIVGYHVPNQEVISLLEDIVSFKIEETGSEMQSYIGSDYGCIVLKCNWSQEELM